MPEGAKNCALGLFYLQKNLITRFNFVICGNNKRITEVRRATFKTVFFDDSGRIRYDGNCIFTAKPVL